MTDMTATAEQDWYSDETSTFGDRVAGAREALGMSQEDLSKRLGVKLKTIQAWEDDLSEPRSNKVVRLSGVLNVSVMWLLNGEGDGLSAPVEEQPLSPDVTALLTELRDLKGQMVEGAERLGRLEKQLRSRLKTENA